jgi:hypothetical protein
METIRRGCGPDTQLFSALFLTSLALCLSFYISVEWQLHRVAKAVVILGVWTLFGGAWWSAVRPRWEERHRSWHLVERYTPPTRQPESPTDSLSALG